MKTLLIKKQFFDKANRIVNVASVFGHFFIQYSLQTSPDKSVMIILYDELSPHGEIYELFFNGFENYLKALLGGPETPRIYMYGEGLFDNYNENMICVPFIQNFPTWPEKKLSSKLVNFKSKAKNMIEYLENNYKGRSSIFSCRLTNRNYNTFIGIILTDEEKESLLHEFFFDTLASISPSFNDLILKKITCGVRITEHLPTETEDIFYD